eukprot:SAG11_NODE_2911_length_2844_cov_4.357013_1_plen_293_part_10
MPGAGPLPGPPAGPPPKAKKEKKHKKKKKHKKHKKKKDKDRGEKPSPKEGHDASDGESSESDDDGGGGGAAQGATKGATKGALPPDAEEAVDLVAASAVRKAKKRPLVGFSKPIHGTSIPTVKKPKSDAEAVEWFYLDKTGKEQGPFCLRQLKEWHGQSYLQNSTQLKHGAEGTYSTYSATLKELEQEAAGGASAASPMYDPLEPTIDGEVGEGGGKALGDDDELPEDLFDLVVGTTTPRYPWSVLAPAMRSAVLDLGYTEALWPRLPSDPNAAEQGAANAEAAAAAAAAAAA